MLRKNGAKSGFTLIEVLLVIAIIAILAAIVIIAVNPGKQLADARNSKRRADINTIISAISQYSIDHNGDLPDTISLRQTDICATGASNCDNLIDLSVLTANGKYVKELPKDPSQGNDTTTAYQVYQDQNSRVTVVAPSAELPDGSEISVTR